MRTRICAPRSIALRLPVLFAPPPAGVSLLWYRVFPGGVLLQYLTTSQVRVGLGRRTKLTPSHYLSCHAPLLLVCNALDLNHESVGQADSAKPIGYWHVVVPK